ncbi:hypothetical protein [Sulfuricurvum sp.]|uniref:hypothetical protein n=1 Tax=Sulfuricurvum sp. TaxID=2025608 RepID=UPI0035650609
MAMIKLEIKYERKPEKTLKMSQLMKDLLTIEEKPEQGKTKGKPLIMQFESISQKDCKIEFNCSEAWDIKDNVISLIESVEAFEWVEEVVDFKRSKK